MEYSNKLSEQGISSLLVMKESLKITKNYNQAQLDRCAIGHACYALGISPFIGFENKARALGLTELQYVNISQMENCPIQEFQKELDVIGFGRITAQQAIKRIDIMLEYGE
jgi:hypothetical protein